MRPRRPKPERSSHGSPLDVHLIGNVLGAGNPVGLLQVKNHLQVIFQAGGKSSVFSSENMHSLSVDLIH